MRMDSKLERNAMLKVIRSLASHSRNNPRFPTTIVLAFARQFRTALFSLSSINVLLSRRLLEIESWSFNSEPFKRDRTITTKYRAKGHLTVMIAEQTGAGWLSQLKIRFFGNFSVSFIISIQLFSFKCVFCYVIHVIMQMLLDSPSTIVFLGLFLHKITAWRFFRILTIDE